MSDKARQYKPSTVRRLDTLSGNECAEPSCRRPLIAEDGKSIISKICHIEAASKNGPRWNSGMTDDERRHYKNLILLCDEHHVIIDNKENEGVYPAKLLNEWKKQHENKMLYKLKQTSVLKTAIYAIADLELGDIEKELETLASFDIDNKISHNDVKRNKYLIEEYKVFYSKVNSIYAELESQGDFKKNKLLKNVRQLYLKLKGKYVSNKETELADIRINADNIIEELDEQIYQLVKSDGDFYQEDITYGISIILVDAFMRCKILEEPPKE